MQLYPQITADADQLTRWRRDLHAHPELGYAEHRTAAFVAAQLEAAGIEVCTGIGRTGVVGRLRRGSAARTIGLRADMDALPMQEENDFGHRSRHDGRFHGCGHDGHTVMLLAAARHLAAHGEFDGTCCFIFQPAEEGGGGAAAMIADGLFERFPMQAVYGLHNYPLLPVGRVAVRAGPMLAAAEQFDVEVRGRGGHGAFPHLAVDPVVTAAQIVQAFQTVVSRSVDPLHTAVVSVTRIVAGDAYNVIPGAVTLGGTIRYFEAEVGATVRRRLAEIATGIAHAAGAEADFVLREGRYPPVVNSAAETRLAVEVARELLGEDAVDADCPPLMGSEDFAFMLERKPGCFIMLGQGGGEGGCMVHHPRYDFNDAIIPLGASYWVRLAERLLAQASSSAAGD